MRVGVLGTGDVGATIASRLAELGHEVCMGSRAAGGERASAWAGAAGPQASESDFEGAARHGEVVFNCTAGMASLDALAAAGAEALAGKVLIDVANPLIFGPAGPGLGTTGGPSLAEQIQAAYPDTQVVKALNTVNRNVMVRPDLLAGDHILMICGNDDAAKSQVRTLLSQFGWGRGRIIDLGGIEAARDTEAYVLLWVRLMRAFGTATFNLIPVLPAE